MRKGGKLKSGGTMPNKNYYGKTSIKRILTGTPEMQELNHRAMTIANNRHEPTPDWSIVSVLRTAEEQNELWYKGRDGTGREMYQGLIVTYRDGYFEKSIHQSGDATDFVPYIDGKADWGNKHAFSTIASCYYEAAMEMGIKIRWGGHFSKFYDGGHIEIVK